MLPAVALAAAPVYGSPAAMAIAGGITVATFAVALLAGGATGGRCLATAGGAAIAVCGWLLAQASFSGSAWVVGGALGVATSLVVGREIDRRAEALLASVVAAAALVVVRIIGGRDGAMAAGAALGAFCAIARVAAGGDDSSAGKSGARSGALACVVSLAFGTAFVGAMSPRVTWFGSLTSSGPRDGNAVAITFDDGPDGQYTLAVAAILDRYGTKGTFFTVGKALDREPDVSRALVDDGHLLGNHSYHHDAVRWLDPRYPELQATQDAFARNLEMCPAFYRPPHGSHTPFMAHEVQQHDMRMVTWDVSAGDWATTDGDLVARRVLDNVRPGSIILLHDGLDGNAGAERSVLLSALPMILDGLKERGLQPVRLDELLDAPGWLDSC